MVFKKRNLSQARRTLAREYLEVGLLIAEPEKTLDIEPINRLKQLSMLQWSRDGMTRMIGSSDEGQVHPCRVGTVTVYIPSWRWLGSGDCVMRISRLSSAGACSIMVFTIPVPDVPKSLTCNSAPRPRRAN